MKKLFVVVAAIALLSLSAASVFAASIFTSEASFLAEIQPGYYLEDFNSWDWETPMSGGTIWNSPSINGYAFTASAIDGIFSLAGSMSLSSSNDTLTITFTGAPVMAVGGLFYGTDLDGNAEPGQLVVVHLYDGTIKNVASPDFLGFTSSAPICSLDIQQTIPHQIDAHFPTLDHLYIGTTVPEPGTMLTLAGFLGTASLILRRRKTS